MEAEQRQVAAIEAAVLGAINDFIDPPTVSGLCVLPDERFDLAQRITDAVSDLLLHKTLAE